MGNNSLDNPSTDLSLPAVAASTVRHASYDKTDTLTLYKRMFEEDENLALYIRQRSIEMAPNDLNQREEIARLALETIELKCRQVLINGLSLRITGDHSRNSTKKSQNPIVKSRKLSSPT